MTALGNAARKPSGQRRGETREARRVDAPDAKRRGNLEPGAAQEMRPRHVPAVTILFRQGDPAREFLVIAPGRLEVTLVGGDVGAPPLAVLEAPGWVGELALMLDEPRSVTLTAAADSEVSVLPGDAFDQFVGSHQVVAKNLLATLTRRIFEKVPPSAWLW